MNEVAFLPFEFQEAVAADVVFLMDVWNGMKKYKILKQQLENVLLTFALGGIYKVTFQNIPFWLQIERLSYSFSSIQKKTHHRSTGTKLNITYNYFVTQLPILKINIKILHRKKREHLQHSKFVPELNLIPQEFDS